MEFFVPPQDRASWKQLAQLATQAPSIRALNSDPARAQQFQLKAAGLRLDFKYQQIDAAALAGLAELARESELPQWLAGMARGELVNNTEQRAALHMALRGPIDGPWGREVGEAVHAERQKMLAYAQALYSGEIKGHTGQTIRTVVNIGIGGSDLGPRLVTEALIQRANPDLQVVFFSMPDAHTVYHQLKDLDVATTLFVISSKSFTTQETMTIANAAKAWLKAGGVPESGMGAHLAAVTTSPDKAMAYGIPANRIFGFWDWVGGRYSVWSSIGLVVAASIGREAFEEFLAGAAELDSHLLSAPIEENLPIQFALHGIWNRNFIGCSSLAVTPYSDRLGRFTQHIQQLDMESNGKSVHFNGQACVIDTGPKVWGGLGMNGQHAYFQLLHQGMHHVPVEFIAVEEGTSLQDVPGWLSLREHDHVVRLNQMAQAQALALGRTLNETTAALRADGLPEDEVARLAPHRTYPGGRPNSTVWLDALSPACLGALIALYEHKVVCQAAIWGINPFDQWGVELGKKLVQDLARGR
ncbi:MAG: glucose-6-phosphate isomerase [Burkholderiaceae bacterium]